MNNPERPLLTIITATRNVTSGIGVERLDRCLQSVATLRIPYEHIIQDGLSTDDTIANCRKFSSDNVRIFSEADTGIYNALNKGLQKARGEWVYILGADDYINDASVIEDVLRHVNKQIDIIASPVWTDEFYPNPAPVYHRLLFCGMVYPHQGIIMRKEVMQRFGGFDERYRIAADCNMLLEMILAGSRVQFIPKAYTHYASSGFSSGNSSLPSEYKRLLQERLDISKEESEVLYRKRLLPLRIIIRYLFRREPSIKVAIRFHAIRFFLSLFGFVDNNGRVIFKR